MMDDGCFLDLLLQMAACLFPDWMIFDLGIVTQTVLPSQTVPH